MSGHSKITHALVKATILGALIAPLAAHADAYNDKLLGDLGGIRPSLASNGIDLGIDYSANAFAVNGGKRDGEAYLHTLNVAFDIDSEKALGISDNRIKVNFLHYAGGNPNSYTGSIEGISSIEAAPSTSKLYELWTEQSFFDNKASALVGLYDINAEFFFTDMSAGFLKPTLEVNQEIAQTGQNGPSIFPTTALAARFKYMPNENLYIQATIADGEPGNSDRPRGTHIDFEDDDGTFSVAEMGYVKDEGFTKLAIGVWRYSKKFDDQVDVDGAGNALKQPSQGVYGLASGYLYKCDSGKNIGAFLRGGVGDGDSG
jgi:porin